MATSAIHQLLNIDPSVSFITHYHLLAIDPKEVTAQRVDQALVERKQMLRQRCPSPQFIPMVVSLEQQLDQAARVLKDPQAHSEYRKSIVSQAKQRTADKRREMVLQARQIIQNSIHPDGSLPPDSRPVVENQLKAIGLPDKDINFLLTQIPSQSTTPVAPPMIPNPQQIPPQQVPPQHLQAPAQGFTPQGTPAQVPPPPTTQPTDQQGFHLTNSSTSQTPPTPAGMSLLSQQDEDAPLKLEPDDKQDQATDPGSLPSTEASNSDPQQQIPLTPLAEALQENAEAAPLDGSLPQGLDPAVELQMEFIYVALKQKLEVGQFTPADMDQLVDLAQRMEIPAEQARVALMQKLTQLGYQPTPVDNQSEADASWAPGFLQSKATEATDDHPGIQAQGSSFGQGYRAPSISAPPQSGLNTPPNTNSEQQPSSTTDQQGMFDPLEVMSISAPAFPELNDESINAVPTLESQGTQTRPDAVNDNSPTSTQNFTAGQVSTPPGSVPPPLPPLTPPPIQPATHAQVPPVQVQSTGMSPGMHTRQPMPMNRPVTGPAAGAPEIKARMPKNRRVELMIGLAIVLVSVIMISALGITIFLASRPTTPNVSMTERQQPEPINSPQSPLNPAHRSQGNQNSNNNPTNPGNQANIQGARLYQSMMWEQDEEKLLNLIGQSSNQNLRHAMRMMIEAFDDLPARQKRARNVFEILLTRKASVPAQSAAVELLSLSLSTSSSQPVIVNSAEILSRWIWLRAPKAEELVDPASRLIFSEQLSNSYKRSVRENSHSPMHDSTRIVQSILNRGGQLSIYASVANPAQLNDVLVALSRIARNPSHRDAALAIQAMGAAAANVSLQASNQALCQLALCHIIMKTANTKLAELARTEILPTVNTGKNPQLGSAKLNTSIARRHIADQLKRHILSNTSTPLPMGTPFAELHDDVVSEQKSAAVLQFDFATDGDLTQLLRDITLLQLAQYERLTRLRGNDPSASRVLRAAKNKSLTMKMLTMYPELMTEDRYLEVSKSALHQDDFTTLSQRITDPNSTRRQAYIAIADLQADGSRKASKALLEALKTVCINPVSERNHKLAARILVALRTIDDRGIPFELLNIVERTRSPYTTQAIFDHLILGTGINVSMDRPHSARPPLIHTRAQRKIAVDYWEAMMGRSNTSWKAKSLQEFLPSSGQKDSPMPKIEPLAVTDRQLATSLAYYIIFSHQVMKGFTWADPKLKVAFPEFVTFKELPNQVEEMTKHSQLFTQDVYKMLTRHPGILKADEEGDSSWVTRANILEGQIKTARLMADNDIQRLMIESEAQGQLLLLLAEFLNPPQGMHHVDLEELQQARFKAIRESDDVLGQWRESMYANLLLWDIVLRKGDQS